MPEQQLPALATHADVLESLGVRGDEDDPQDISMLPDTMAVRMDGTLEKVSRRFRKEAQRIFTPGVYTHRLAIHAGATRLMEVPSKVVKVRVQGLRELDWGTGDSAHSEPLVEGDDFGEIEPPSPLADDTMAGPLWHVNGAWMYWQNWSFWRLNGREVEITYAWDTPVPKAVRTSVADMVARNLSVDPMSPLSQSKLLQSRHHRQEVAEWVYDGTTGFTPDDIAEMRAYRYPAPPIIIAQLSMVAMSPSQAFLSDSSW